MTTTTERTLVNFTVTDGIAVIELTNLPANTYSYEMMSQLDEAILQARFDESVHVLVIRGAGDRFFCAGADINMLNTVTPTFKYYFCLHANETLTRLEQTPKLVIAALNGHTVGGGLEIALACDIRIARRSAGKVAIELMTEGKLITFEEAQDLGLINYIYEPENFWEDVMNYARQFCPPNKASRTVGRIKRSVQSGSEVSLSEALAIERELQQLCFQSEDAKEGLAASIEKRKPSFAGR